MSELLMMEAALFQLRAALEDDPELLPIRLSANVLANAVSAAKAGGINAARVNDIEFALNDLVAAVDDAGAPDAVCTAVALLQNDTALLRKATALAPEILEAIHGLQARLLQRGKALERSQYRAEGTEADALPLRLRSCDSWPSRCCDNSRPRASTHHRSSNSSPIPIRCAITRSTRSSTSST
jgi:hypothetical protein